MTDNNLTFYGDAVFIRAFEQEIATQFDAGHVPGLVHLCTGAEVAELALARALISAIDKVTGSHRSHGLALALGADPFQIACEILGRKGGLSDGLAGTQHLLAPDSGFLTSNGIVGAQVPLAAGAALSAKTNGTNGIGVAVFGDGAANQGAVLETMNLSVALSLPMMFVLENNGFGQSTTSDYASGSVSFNERAAAFGLHTLSANGYDYNDCKEAFTGAVSICRSNAPVFVEVSVPRLSGHYHGEDTGYTTKGLPQDPLEATRVMVEASGVSAESLDETAHACHHRAGRIVADAVAALPADDTRTKAWHQNLEAVRGR